MIHATIRDNGNGTFTGVVNKGDKEWTCHHRHTSESSASGCADWQRRGLYTGTDHWAEQIIERDARRSSKKRSRTSAPSFDGIQVGTAASDDDDETVSDEDAAGSHEYVPMPKLLKLWHAVVSGAKSRPAANLLFVGPSGSGKTDGARHLAALVGLPFTKVDAASMTDPEAWFGTRELVVEDGVAVTRYDASDFVEAVQQPGVVLIDEITRVRDEHRNVLLPILDMTREVMNPLTGEAVRRHPQCFVIMAGNVGVHFTGTNAVDPAFLTRALTVEFEYIDSETETRVVKEASGCSDQDAAVFVRFASETRIKASVDPEFLPLSTREVIAAGMLTADGLDRDLAVEFTVLNATSAEGGDASIRRELQNIWNGVRVMKVEAADSEQTAVASGWTCPDHGRVKHIPAGVSQKTGRPYISFNACPVVECTKTEDRSR